MESLKSIMNDEYTIQTDAINTVSESMKYPELCEIALTYRCQNKCDFCSTSGSLRIQDLKEMTTRQVKLIIDKVFNDAGIRIISFTGGEPAMRKDLPELIEYGVNKEIKINLITNGIKCSDNELVKRLAGSGLHSARVNLESDNELIHNRITGNIESYTKTIAGIHHLIESGIRTITNTTICRENREHLIPLVNFVKDEFGLNYLIMNMITGKVTDKDNTGYSSIPAILDPVLKYCNKAGIKLACNTPVPHCILNPVDYNLRPVSCSCVSGTLSVNPAGEVIPCSSHNRVIGNLLDDSFNNIWNSNEALYFRENKFIPSVCKKCGIKTLCKGACPIYWENAGSFREIKKANNRIPLFGKFFHSPGNSLTLKTKDIRESD